MSQDFVERVARTLYEGRPDTKLSPVDGGVPGSSVLHPKRWEDASERTKAALLQQSKEMLMGDGNGAPEVALRPALERALAAGDDGVAEVLSKAIDRIEDQAE